ncbi:MAG TPA: hypothetical protein VNR00_18545, partial [Opitutus sp.]|nr:hypothetical protein [Opitutus sp.]
MIVGAVFTGAVALTVTMKLALAEADPSLTVILIVDVPVRPEAGLTVTVRFAPLPPNVTALVGTSVVLLEV